MAKFTKRTAVIAGVSALAISGGAAWAFTGWTVSGTGSAEAEASEIKPLTATSSFGEKLYPGLSTTVATVVNNPNDFPVQFTGTAAITGIVVEDEAANGTCTTGLGAAGVINTNFPGTPTIPETTTDHSITSNITFGSIPQACAGKEIEIKYSFSGVSKA